MANICPNVNTPEAKALIKQLGLLGFYKEYIKNGYNIPSAELTSKLIANNKEIDALPKIVGIFNKNISKINQWFNNKAIDENTFYKKLQELGIPKDQLELYKNVDGNNPEEKLLNFIANYSYTVEINTAKTNEEKQVKQFGDNEEFTFAGSIYEYKNNEYLKDGDVIDLIEYETAKNDAFTNPNTSHYSNLTVPGGINYTENEISTPLITPSIKGHAQFSTDNGIGWFRSDDKTITEKSVNKAAMDAFDLDDENESSILKEVGTSKTRRILEVQSDLFQKGRGRTDVAKITEEQQETFRKIRDEKSFEEATKYLDSIKENQFLQLLNKNNNWVNFFVKSIIQDSAKQTITEVQESDVEAKVRELEKEGLLEIDCKGKLKAEKGLATSFTKGGKWKVIKDLKGYPTHKEGGVDLTIGKNGVSIKNGNTQFTAKHGLVIPKN